MGPKKAKGRARTAATALQTPFPAPSTIGDILKRNGLVVPRRNRSRHKATPTWLRHALAPNDVWCIDYKGQFRLGDRSYCYPLTIADQFSRFILCCEGMGAISDEAVYPEHDDVRRVGRDGYLYLAGRRFYITAALAGQPLGLREGRDGRWLLTFMDLDLGHLNRDGRLVPINASTLRRPDEPATHVPGQKRHPCSRLHSGVDRFRCSGSGFRCSGSGVPVPVFRFR